MKHTEEIIKYAAQTMNHLIQKGETLSLIDFSNRIALTYDITNPKTKEIIKTLKSQKNSTIFKNIHGLVGVTKAKEMEQIKKIEFTGSQENFKNLLALINHADNDLPKMKITSDRDLIFEALSEAIADTIGTTEAPTEALLKDLEETQEKLTDIILNIQNQ